MGDNGDGVGEAKMMRPNDLYSASFFGDIKKVKEILFQEAVDEEPPFDEDFDALAPADEDGDAAAKERAEKRQANAEELAAKLAASGLIVSRLSPVHVTTYGLGIVVTEVDMKCSVKFKASSKSTQAATALHWAVLGREHDIVRYLVELGASTDALTPDLNTSVVAVARENKLLATQQALAEGAEVFAAKREAGRAVTATFQAEVDRRAAARVAAHEEVKRKEEEEAEAERVAAERVAAAAAAAAAAWAAEATAAAAEAEAEAEE
jgi:hypothetical protein